MYVHLQNSSGSHEGKYHQAIFNGTDNNKNGFANMLASTAWSAHSSVLPSPGQFIGTVCMDAHVFPGMES